MCQASNCAVYSELVQGRKSNCVYGVGKSRWLPIQKIGREVYGIHYLNVQWKHRIMQGESQQEPTTIS